MNMIPKPSEKKDLPTGKLDNKEIPIEKKLLEEQPTETTKIKVVPDETKQLETIPDATPVKEEMPSDEIEENCVIIGNEKIELKPTKLKYFRNKAASAYGIIKAVPLYELLTYGKGTIDETRDADQLLFDFLVAAFDSSEFVRDHYDEMDADTIDRVCKIFGRLNHIDEKEEAARKNKEAQAAKH
jgi:hypothetical protein